MSTTLKDLHDRMLEGKPEGASHDASECPLCVGEVASDTSITGGSVAEAKTYSQEEYDALSAQVEGLKTKVSELTTASEASEIDAKIAEAKAELEAQVSDLQAKLDASVLEAQAAKEERDAIASWLDNEKLAAEAAAELAARKDERIARVKEVASFPDEYLEANADRFAAMSDELFEAALEDWKTIAPKGKSSDSKDDIPANTAMTASRSETTGTSVLTEVLGLRFQGLDTRTV